MKEKEAFKRVLYTLKRNKSMVKMDDDGINIRLADPNKKGAFTLEWGKVFSYEDKVRDKIKDSKFQDIIKNLKAQLDFVCYEGDLSDLGNEIGIAIGKSIEANKNKLGYELEDFINGVKHGVSLVDGTH